MAMAFTADTHEEPHLQLLGTTRSYTLLPEPTVSPPTTNKKLKTSVTQHWKKQIKYLTSS